MSKNKNFVSKFVTKLTAFSTKKWRKQQKYIDARLCLILNQLWNRSSYDRVGSFKWFNMEPHGGRLSAIRKWMAFFWKSQKVARETASIFWKLWFYIFYWRLFWSFCSKVFVYCLTVRHFSSFFMLFSKMAVDL